MKPLAKTYKPGMHLFHENDRSRELYIVQSGTVKVYRTVGARELELARMGKGAVLGEMALIDGRPRSASAKALEESNVILIDAETFHNKIKGVPPWFMAIVRMTSQKIRQANQRLQTMSSEHPGFNIVLALQHCAAKFGKDGELDLAATKVLLLHLLAITHHRLVRVLESLQKNEFIELTDTSIKINDPARFRQYCAFLRLMIRKSFDKMTPLSEHTVQLMKAIGEKFPDTMLKHDGTTEIPGEAFSAALAQIGAEGEGKTILASLREAGIAGVVKKDGAEQAENAASGLAGVMVNVNNQAWMRRYLFDTYHTMVPAL